MKTPYIIVKQKKEKKGKKVKKVKARKAKERVKKVNHARKRLKTKKMRYWGSIIRLNMMNWQSGQLRNAKEQVCLHSYLKTIKMI